MAKDQIEDRMQVRLFAGDRNSRSCQLDRRLK